ncbi:hypothetical protein DLM86_15980 [Paenibacillus flagellatus]|uniref:Response regulatory domain-containing protein n=2 Tax=Paenibacillus flagellatus TaxID=2211139 RepID=A0A2V5K457_9BACL|nr:hypothetical protein DLM86_15980 [Paenibacillus flagellatus]
MMRAILTDDEDLALRYLEKLLRDIGDVDIIGKYYDAEEALEAACTDPPDVIFFDIDMPGISGIEAAERLSERLPATDVVFVTAYEEYAIKAFELNAVDYILKPVEEKRLACTIARLRSSREHKPAVPHHRPAMIRCFQLLEVDVDKPETIPWRTTKAQELFAFLIHYRDQPVRKDVLLDLLWPDVDMKKGYAQLYTAIYQIRKTVDALGIGLRIVNHEKGYRLELNDVRLDIEEWERSVMEANDIGPDNLEHHLALLDMYRGDYLADYDYLWAEGERQRLKTIWLRHAMAVAEWLDRTDKDKELFALYFRALRMFPYSEEVHFALLKLHAKQGDWAAVEKQYADLERMVRSEFGTDVPASIQSWYKEWKTS